MINPSRGHSFMNLFHKDIFLSSSHEGFFSKKRPGIQISRHSLVQVRLRVVPASGDWAAAPWLQQHSESHFFWDTIVCRTNNKRTFFEICAFLIRNEIKGVNPESIQNAKQLAISLLNLDLSVQKCDYPQDQEDNLRNLAYILASCVASEMTSGVRATLLFVGHQLRPIGLPVACTVVFCTASSACSTSANMPLGCM